MVEKADVLLSKANGERATEEKEQEIATLRDQVERAKTKLQEALKLKAQVEAKLQELKEREESCKRLRELERKAKERELVRVAQGTTCYKCGTKENLMYVSELPVVSK